jgi:hypothetical protein
MRTIGVIALATGALIWGAGAAAASAETSGKGAIARATSLLAGKRFTSSHDERLHLCGGGRFVYDELSSPPAPGHRVARAVGRWTVLSASFGRTREVVRVRGVTRDRALIVTIVSDGRRTTVGGDAAVVDRSDVCR